MPEIWVYHSNKVLGYTAPQSLINERYVTATIVAGWLEKGYSEYQVGLLYNGGSLKEKKGVNKWGVKYDTKAYALILVANARELKN